MKYPIYIIDSFTRLLFKKNIYNNNINLAFTLDSSLNDKIVDLLHKKELDIINYLIHKHKCINPTIDSFFGKNDNYKYDDNKVTYINKINLKILNIKSSLDPLNKIIICNNKKVNIIDIINMMKTEKVKLHISVNCYGTYNKEKNIIYTRCKLLNIKVIESKIDKILDDSSKYKQFNKPYYPNKFIKKNPLINSVTQNILNILNKKND